MRLMNKKDIGFHLCTPFFSYPASKTKIGNDIIYIFKNLVRKLFPSKRPNISLVDLHYFLD